MRKKIMAILLSGAMVFSLLFSANVSRAEEYHEEITCKESAGSGPCVTYGGSNIEEQDYCTWSTPIYSYMANCPNGNYMLVEKINGESKIFIQYFDSSFNFLSNRELTLDLPLFGGFYETDSNYYLLTGQSNPNEDDNVEVFG